MIRAEDCGLLIVDIQGKLARMVANSDTLIKNTVKLIKCCQSLSIPIVVLEQNPDGLGPTTPEIQASLEDTTTLEKYTFNGMSEPAIRAHIAKTGKKRWLVAGIEAHICVYQTVKGLLCEDLDVELVSDCVSSRLDSNVTLAIDNMRHSGAHITSLEMCVFEIMQSSQSDDFKELLRIIK